MRQSNKKERSDKGSIRINSRDFRCLSWLSEMGSAYEDDLSVVLNPTHRISTGAAKAVVRRWQQADLARAEALFANRGRIIRLTENGARLVGDVDRWDEGSVTGAVHTAEVARTRLLLEGWPSATELPVVGWIGPQRWRAENEHAVAGGAHVPDGVACFADGSTAAIKVERINRGLAQARTVAIDLLTHFPRTVYAFPDVSGDMRRMVRTAVGEAMELIRARGTEPGKAVFIRIPDRLADDPVRGVPRPDARTP